MHIRTHIHMHTSVPFNAYPQPRHHTHAHTQTHTHTHTCRPCRCTYWTASTMGRSYPLKFLPYRWTSTLCCSTPTCWLAHRKSEHSSTSSPSLLFVLLCASPLTAVAASEMPPVHCCAPLLPDYHCLRDSFSSPYLLFVLLWTSPLTAVAASEVPPVHCWAPLLLAADAG